MKYLLDTNIISELRRKSPNKNVINWFESLDSNDLYISCITMGELRTGALKKAKTDNNGGQLLLKWVDKLINDYEEQIIDIDMDVCEEWAKCLTIDATNAVDGLVAAQAISMNLTLVTRNTKHFKMFDIKLLNPFELDQKK